MAGASKLRTLLVDSNFYRRLGNSFLCQHWSFYRVFGYDKKHGVSVTPIMLRN